MLPGHISPCSGVGLLDGDGIHWRKGCETCLRRTLPPADPGRARPLTPPPIIVFSCEFLIEPGTQMIGAPASDPSGR